MSLNNVHKIQLRPLEREDLHFVHTLTNNDTIMRYWFEEPYEAYDELVALYDRHIHEQNERRFIIQNEANQLVGLVELVEIDYVHRRAEFQILIDPQFHGCGYAQSATKIAVGYAFRVLNLYKVYLIVDTENSSAIHIYKKCGFHIEGHLKKEFFINGSYRDALRMCLMQEDYLSNSDPVQPNASVLREE